MENEKVWDSYLEDLSRIKTRVLVDWKEALESAVSSHRRGDLDEWELHLIGRRVEAALAEPPKPS